MAFVKRSKGQVVGVIEDKDIILNDQDTRKAVEKAAKELNLPNDKKIDKEIN